MTQKIWYSPSDCGGHRFELEVNANYDATRPREQEDIARECAADYRNNHDGWESQWPLEFALYESEGGPELAKLFVEIDFEPVFYARHATPNAVLSGERSESA